MIQDRTYTAGRDDVGLRLDRFVTGRIPATSRGLVLDALAAGTITVNGRSALKGQKLAAGDEVRVARLLEVADVMVRPNPSLPLTIVFEDDDLLVLDKPPDMPVHPLKADETGTLANALVARYPGLAAIGDDPLFPALVHRIDTDTSGLVLAAKTTPAYDFLREEFRRHRVVKRYVALVRGRASGGARLEDFLAHHPVRPGRMVVVDGAQRKPRPMPAVTEYSVAQRFSACTLLDVTIKTGVTHQIRCQLAAAGYPIAGDEVYGGAAAGGEPGLQRHFLHAAALEVVHPRTQQTVSFTSPLPADLADWLRRLR